MQTNGLDIYKIKGSHARRGFIETVQIEETAIEA
jgi:hypothetical protein